jgi:hypothetical protein
MADQHQVVFYPVSNGDTSQITLPNDKRILFDFCHRPGCEQEDSPDIDLKNHLKEELNDAKRDYFDVVAFTHADKDHIQGSTSFFWLEHAKKYQGDHRIKMKQLWVPAAMVLESASDDEQSAEFVILRQEARHRLLEGKGILVFSQPPELMDWLVPALKARGEKADARDHLFVDAGTLVPGYTLVNDQIEFFCHSPFIEHCEDGDIIRNSAALVFNIRMQAGGQLMDYLEVGDADWEDLERIVKATRKHKNDDRLNWDLFNIPHHCSYLSLSDEKGEKETVPKPLVKALLLQGQEGAYIVSCSKPIADDKEAYEQTQPPHIQARNAYENYLEQVDGRKFLVTMEEPNAYKPKPITFEFTVSGLAWKKTAAAAAGSAGIITSKPLRAG